MKNLTSQNRPLTAARLLDRLRERIRYMHYSQRTEEAYVYWVRAYIRFHRLRHPEEMAATEVEQFLAWLANERKVSAATHRQALSALLFLYQRVLGVDLPWLKDIGRPAERKRLPVVLSTAEVSRILAMIDDDEHRLFAQLLFGTGMRLTEGLRLRIKDVDFDHNTIVVREGKGAKDRTTMLPQSLVPALHAHIAHARAVWTADHAAGSAGVDMPYALDRKYPRAGASWAWFWVFPQDALSRDPRSGVVRRHHKSTRRSSAPSSVR